jgi:hypothetical protein
LAEHPIPGVAAAVDDLASGLENAVREAIVSEMQPEPLDRLSSGE